MKKRRVLHFAPLAVALAVAMAFGLVARSASAADAPCGALSIETDAKTRARFPELPRRVEEAFATRRDVDTCARVKLTIVRGAIAVDVELPDGRATSRTGLRRDDVVPTLEALLFVPHAAAHATPTAEEARATPTSEETRTTPTPEETRTTPAFEGAPATPVDPAEPVAVAPDIETHSSPAAETPIASPGAAPSRVRAELSLETGARVGDGQTSLGAGAISFLDVAGWLGGFQGRVERYQPMSDGTPSAALSLGALGGRRFAIGAHSIDVFVGPAVALRGVTSATTVARLATGGGGDSPAAPPIVDKSAQGMVPRGVFGARVCFGARSILRSFIGIDGDFGPRGGPDSTTAAALPGPPSPLHSLPIFSVGIALGVTVGTR
jgi:hypothetical protein